MTEKLREALDEATRMLEYLWTAERRLGEVRALVEHRLGLYVLAAERSGQTAEDALAVIGDRDPYLANALAALSETPDEPR